MLTDLEVKNIIKTAGIMDTATRAGKAIKGFYARNPAATQVTILTSAGLAGAAFDSFFNAMKEWFKKNNGQKKKNEYFEKMLTTHPDLMKEDPEMVAKYWDSLYHFAPMMAADPLAAGSYIQQSLQRGYGFGGPPPDVFRTLADIQKTFNDRLISTPKKTTPLLDNINAYVSAVTLMDKLDQKVKGKLYDSPALSNYTAVNSE